MSSRAVPPGYSAFRAARARVVSRDDVATAVRHATSGGTLYEWATRVAGASPLEGRRTAWAAELSPGLDVVVRHSAHGGLLAPLTGDLFLAPTRAPVELANALWLSARAIRTPPVLAYVVYPVAGGMLARADVMTQRVPGEDLAAAWSAAPGDSTRAAIATAVAELLRSMRAAGVLHPDLNIKNILLSRSMSGIDAVLLDVDRVGQQPAGDSSTAMLNLVRLQRSAAKWHREQRLPLDDHFFGMLRATISGGPA